MRLTKDFMKTALTGVLATGLDMGTLYLLVTVMGFSPEFANGPSLAVGAGVQFLGNRYFAFDSAHQGRLEKQLAGFFAAEVASLILNAVLFHVLVSWFHLPYWLARPAGTFLVFLSFSYPLWKLIFKNSPTSRTTNSSGNTKAVGN